MPRLLLLLVALVVATAGLLLTTTTTGTAVTAVRAVACGDLLCGHGQGAVSTQGQGHPTADPCGHHHPLCGDAGTTSADAEPALLGALAAVGLVTLLASLAGRPVWPAGARLRSALLASGLEHPPRRLA
jgi:hypothetical protein